MCAISEENNRKGGRVAIQATRNGRIKSQFSEPPIFRADSTAPIKELTNIVGVVCCMGLESRKLESAKSLLAPTTYLALDPR